MPRKADKTTQNSALQGISEQENFMIRVLFICHGRDLGAVISGDEEQKNMANCDE